MKKIFLISLIISIFNVSNAAEKYAGIWKNQKNCNYPYQSLGLINTEDIEILPNGAVFFGHWSSGVPFNGKVYESGKIALQADNIGTLTGKIKNETFELKFREYTSQNIFNKMRKCNIKFVKDYSNIKEERQIKTIETNLAFESNKQLNLILELPNKFENFIKSKSI